MLKHEGAENFNWNYVDQHILGYQDFAEFPEVGKILNSSNLMYIIMYSASQSSRYQKFRCRYLLLPTEQLWSEQQDSQLVTQLVAGFVKLLDFLNHIKRQQVSKGRWALLSLL